MDKNISPDNVRKAIYESGLIHSTVDDDAILRITEYVNGSADVSGIDKRLDEVENAFSEIMSKSTVSVNRVVSVAGEASGILRKLTSLWRSRGLLREFTFSFTDEECDFLKDTYLRVARIISSYTKLIAEGSVSVADCASQMRACSAESAEIAYESRIAELAFTLYPSDNMISKLRTTFLRSRATGHECQKATATYLGFTRNCASVIAMLNISLANAAEALRIGAEEEMNYNVISPVKAAYALNSAVMTIERTELRMQ